MTAITFDTLKFVQTLKESGLTEKQAEGITIAFREAHSSAELATKGDIDALCRDMKEMEYRLTIRLGGMIAASVAVVTALVKLL